MGMESPETACHSEHVTASSVQADDSYRNVLAVGVRSEAAGGGFFCCPGTTKERAASDGFPDRLSGWRAWRSAAAWRQSDLGTASWHRVSVSHDVRERLRLVRHGCAGGLFRVPRQR